MEMKYVISILIIGIVFVSGCSINSEINLPDKKGTTWVEKHLTQCAEERKNQLYKNEEDLKELYETKYNVTIYNVKREKVRADPCEACNCLSETKLYLQVSDNDVNKVLKLNYTIL